MIATGVARPSAHGHVMTQHADAARERKREREAQQQPDHQRDGRNADDGRHKDPRDPVGRAGQRGFGGGGVLHQADNLDSVVSWPTRVARQVSAPFWLMVAALTVSPAALSTGMLSPVRAALVHAGFAFQHNAVDRDALARAHQEDVAGPYFGNGHRHLLAAAHKAGGLRGRSSGS